MRVERALDKARALLARRGVTSTAATLATVLAHPVSAAPAGLAATITSSALVGASSGLTAATFMGLTKLQLGLTGAIVAAGVGGFIVQYEQNARLRAEALEISGQVRAVGDLQVENQRMVQSTAEVAELRRDAAELARLREEVAALKAPPKKAAPTPMTATLNGEPVFPAAQLDQQPKPTFQARPMYPPELRQAGFSGEAVIEVVVDTKGEVQNAQAVQSTHPALADAALEAVKQWTFSPGMKSGIHVNARMQIPVVFSMDATRNKALGAQSASPWF